MFPFLIYLEFALVIGGMTYIYAKTRDVFHPLFLLLPIFAFIYGIMPYNLNEDRTLTRYFTTDQLVFVQILNCSGTLAFILGGTMAGMSVVRPRTAVRAPSYSLLGGDIILSLAFAEPNDGNFLLSRKCLQDRHESLADRIHQGAGGELVPAMKSEATGYSFFALQFRDVNVQIIRSIPSTSNVTCSASTSATVRGIVISASVRLRSFGIDCRFGGLNRWRELLAVLHCRPEPSLGLCAILRRDGNTTRRSEAEPRWYIHKLLAQARA